MGAGRGWSMASRREPSAQSLSWGGTSRLRHRGALRAAGPGRTVSPEEPLTQTSPSPRPGLSGMAGGVRQVTHPPGKRPAGGAAWAQLPCLSCQKRGSPPGALETGSRAGGGGASASPHARRRAQAPFHKGEAAGPNSSPHDQARSTPSLPPWGPALSQGSDVWRPPEPPMFSSVSS